MKAGLQLRLGQSLTLTPQLRQAIRLLQLSSVELETEVNLALESNPLLERLEDREPDAADDAERGERDVPVERAEPGERTDEHDEHAERDTDFADELAWSEPSGARSEGGDDRRELAEAEGESLIDHLLWQLNLTPLSARDRAIGVTLIEALGEDGYLHESVEALAASLRPEIEADGDEIEAVRHLIQHFDPLGVASRTLSECLCVQLGALDPTTPGRALACAIAERELEALAKLGCDRLARQLGEPAAAVQQALALLRSLDPRPGAQIAPATVDYVVPDAFAVRQQGRWEARLAADAIPRVGINRRYQALIGATRGSDASYLRGQLQEARWLLKSLQTRAETLLKVARAIVGRQSGFLDHGPEAMRPLVLREIAEEVGLHESTVSRVTTRKYLHTPRGTFEFKHFFSSSLSTEDGGSASSTAIQAILKRLIEAEDPRRPLSDARLAAELKAAGVTVARRTVAKYREAMNIPSSNERQRVG